MPEFDNIPPEEMQKMMAEIQQRENAGLSPEEQAAKQQQKELQKQKNREIFQETEKICNDGGYAINGKKVSLGFSREKMSEIHVFLPEEITALPDFPRQPTTSPGQFRCLNIDALSLAKEVTGDPSYQGGVLVLNLASAIRPGGATRDGANGQEEDICRKSSLFLSLESEAASRYYTYNHQLNTRLGSDGVMISPNVAVFRNGENKLLETPFSIAILTCAAPMVRLGFEGKTEEEYQKMLTGRIEGMLRCARAMGYRNLILGAFGCGVFGNDAAVVSDAFAQVLTGPIGNDFEHIDFAVLCTPEKPYNYNEFFRNFSGNNGNASEE